MKTYYTEFNAKIQSELKNVNEFEITLEDSIRIIDFLKRNLSDLRDFFISKTNLTVQEEIYFFKEIKPNILSELLFFNKIYSLKLNRPNGSYETVKIYYEKELSVLTRFFEKHLPFYQYYRLKSTHFDEFYFIRNKSCKLICTDSTQFIADPLFSSGYDYIIAKIICNEKLLMYLDKKINYIQKFTDNENNRISFPQKHFKWTASKAAAIELGYSLCSSMAINNGNVDIKDIMTFLGSCFNIDLGDYYRSYLSIKNRKKDRTPFLNLLINGLINRMELDESDK